LLVFVACCFAAQPHTIEIDGDFSDWDSVPAYYDPADTVNGTVLADGVYDVHDTNSDTMWAHPSHVYNPIADLVEYKFTHDDENFYAYFRVSGTIGQTSVANSTSGSKAGRCYLIVTIDLDQEEESGYWLNEGGYYPTSGGYDINFEVEYYNGTLNTGHYLNHGCHNEFELQQAFLDQANGQIHLGPGFYNYYSEWVFWDVDQPPTEDEISRCPDGMKTLPDDQGYLCFVVDKAPGPFQGIVTAAKNENELEMRAPYRGLLKEGSQPFVHPGMTINVSFSVETSGEYSTPVGEWCSDTGNPILGYVMESNNTVYEDSSIEYSESGDRNWKSLGALGIVVLLESVIMLFLCMVMIGGMVWYKKGRKQHYEEVE